MALINGGSGSNELQISNGGARVLLYDASGNPIYRTNLTEYTAPTAQGIPMMGQDGDLYRIPRVTQDGSFQASLPQVLFFDAVEGATVNTDRWISTVTTMTITQAAGLGTLFNAGSSVATTVGAMLTSKALMPIIPIGGCLRYRSRLQNTTAHANDNLIEVGFGDPAAATNAQLVNGVVLRKNASGQRQAVVCMNSAEQVGTTVLDNNDFLAAVPVGEYYEVEIQVFIDAAVFWIRTADGTILFYERLDYQGTFGNWSTSHLRVMQRTYNVAATATAVQFRSAGTAVDLLDRAGHFKPWGEQMTGQFLDGLTSPLAFTQSANWTNSGAATTRTLSNTAAAETTPGGILVANATAGAATDYIMFGYTVPTGYNLNVRGIRISAPYNAGAAIATTDTLIQYFFATNSTAVSLATASAMRQALPGFHRGPVGLAIGAVYSGADIDVVFPDAIRVCSARFFHIGCRIPVGTATASQTINWTVSVRCYFD